MIWLSEHLLTAPIMALLWGSAMSVSALAAYYSRRWAMGLIGFGSLGYFVFYLWTTLGWWTSYAEAVAFSRFAGAVLTINLTLGAYLMLRAAIQWKT